MKEKLFYLFAVMFAVTFGLHSLGGFGTPKEIRSLSFVVVDSNNVARAVISSDAQGGRVRILNAKGDTVISAGVMPEGNAFISLTDPTSNYSTLGLLASPTGSGSILHIDSSLTLSKATFEPF